MSILKRHVIEGKDRTATIQALQGCLIDLIDMALQGKQAHWNVVGPNFRSIHLQLDEIIATTREASDAVAERIVTLAESADGRAATVAAGSHLEPYPSGLQQVGTTVTLIADRLQAVTRELRNAIRVVAEADPVSQDLLIGATQNLEKHLWMVQAQEG